MTTPRVMSSIWIVVACLCCVATGESAGATSNNARSPAVFPSDVRLSTVRARQRLVVQWVRPDGQLMGQINDDIQWSSSNQNVASVVAGVVAPVGNGTATITVKVNGKTATTNVVVTNQEMPFTWSFRNHVESVLSKSGCNSGACHGARAGKKGFR